MPASKRRVTQSHLMKCDPACSASTKPPTPLCRMPWPTLLDGIEPPLYIVFDVDESGAVDDFRVVNVHEFPVQVLESL